MEGIIIMVGQSKIVIFLAPWKGLLLLSLANQKNIHFLGPMEGIIIIMVGQSKKHSFSRPRGEYWSILGMFTTQTKRPTFDGVECSKCLGTNLDSFEANWILELELWGEPTLASWFFKSWALSFLVEFFSCIFSGLNQLIFPPKWCHVSLASNLPLFGLEPSSKGPASNLWLSSNRIMVLFHWTLDLGHLSKVRP